MWHDMNLISYSPKSHWNYKINLAKWAWGASQELLLLLLKLCNINAVYWYQLVLNLQSLTKKKTTIQHLPPHQYLHSHNAFFWVKSLCRHFLICSFSHSGIQSAMLQFCYIFTFCLKTPWNKWFVHTNHRYDCTTDLPWQSVLSLRAWPCCDGLFPYDVLRQVRVFRLEWLATIPGWVPRSELDIVFQTGSNPFDYGIKKWIKYLGFRTEHTHTQSWHHDQWHKIL